MGWGGGRMRTPRGGEGVWEDHAGMGGGTVGRPHEGGERVETAQCPGRVQGDHMVRKIGEHGETAQCRVGECREIVWSQGSRRGETRPVEELLWLHLWPQHGAGA